MTTTELAQLPADATHADQWADLDDDGQLQRHFTGTRHGEHVSIIGLQHATGQVERCVGVTVDPRDEVLTPTAARALAGALLAAATEADQLDAAHS